MIDITFRVNCYLGVGEQLCISGSSAELGGNDEEKAVPLAPIPGTNDLNVTVNCIFEDEISYRYIIRTGQGSVAFRESRPRRFLRLYPGERKVSVIDHLLLDKSQNLFYTSAFRQILTHHYPDKEPGSSRKGFRLVVKTCIPYVPSGGAVRLVGNLPSLGAWQPDDAPKMQYAGDGYWLIQLDLDPNTRMRCKHFEYKPVLDIPTIKDDAGQRYVWDEGPNHRLDLGLFNTYDVAFIDTKPFDTNVYRPRFAGTAIPLFAIRTDDDWGIGDFGGLKQMVDWATETEQSIIQILPINDTTLTRSYPDSYPYNAISMYALHPLYFDISALPELQDLTGANDLFSQAARLRKTNSIEYDAVFRVKYHYLYLLFGERGDRDLRSDAYRNFLSKNTHWLDVYAAYSAKRDLLQYKDDTRGGVAPYGIQSMDTADLQRIAEFYRWMQYHLYIQFDAVCKYAVECRVVIKGDLPVGISIDSVDVQAFPDYFDTSLSVGAPPDNFSPHGQNWGFPPMHRGKGARNCNSERIERMNSYYTAIRIDHVLGFFRMWTIPRSQVSGLLGYFTPSKGFSADEICAFGYDFSAELDTVPVISECYLRERFGVYASAVIQAFFISCQTEQKTYMLSELLRSGTYVAAMPAETIPGGEMSRATLLDLITEVPFIPDIHLPDCYHPRIDYDKSRRFSVEDPYRQSAWCKLNADYYHHRNCECWYQGGRTELEDILRNTDMLVCVEDLGFIPEEVPRILQELNLLTLELERFAKVPGANHTHLEALPYACVVTTSTHDLPPLRYWWQSLSEEQRITYLVQVDPEAAEGLPANRLFPDMANRIVGRHLASPAMFAILPLADWFATTNFFGFVNPEDEQINHPENPEHYWIYRMPCTVSYLRQHAPVINQSIRSLIQASGRGRGKEIDERPCV